MEKTIITKNQLITSIIINGGNSLIFIFYLKELFLNFHLLKYLTYISYYANSIFLLLCLICDIFLYINENSEEESNYILMNNKNSYLNNNILWAEKLNNWNRNKYGVICNTFSFFVSVSFWILYFLGESYIKMNNTFFGLLSSINLHLLITIFVIIDIFISKRKHKFSADYFEIISFIFFVYCIICGIDKYYFNVNPYPFMNGSLLFLIIYVLISFFLLYGCYFFNVYLINYNKKEIVPNIELIKEE